MAPSAVYPFGSSRVNIEPLTLRPLIADKVRLPSSSGWQIAFYFIAKLCPSLIKSEIHVRILQKYKRVAFLA